MNAGDAGKERIADATFDRLVFEQMPFHQIRASISSILFHRISLAHLRVNDTRLVQLLSVE